MAWKLLTKRYEPERVVWPELQRTEPEGRDNLRRDSEQRSRVRGEERVEESNKVVVSSAWLWMVQGDVIFSEIKLNPKVPVQEPAQAGQAWIISLFLRRN